MDATWPSQALCCFSFPTWLHSCSYPSCPSSPSCSSSFCYPYLSVFSFSFWHLKKAIGHHCHHHPALEEEGKQCLPLLSCIYDSTQGVEQDTNNLLTHCRLSRKMLRHGGTLFPGHSCICDNRPSLWKSTSLLCHEENVWPCQLAKGLV